MIRCRLVPSAAPRYHRLAHRPRIGWHHATPHAHHHAWAKIGWTLVCVSTGALAPPVLARDMPRPAPVGLAGWLPAPGWGYVPERAVPVPEPPGAALVGLGLLGLLAARRWV